MQTASAIGGADLGQLGFRQRAAGLHRRRAEPAETVETLALDLAAPERAPARPSLALRLAAALPAERPCREIRIAAAARAFADAAALGAPGRLDLRA